MILIVNRHGTPAPKFFETAVAAGVHMMGKDTKNYRVYLLIEEVPSDYDRLQTMLDHLIQAARMFNGNDCN